MSASMRALRNFIAPAMNRLASIVACAVVKYVANDKKLMRLVLAGLGGLPLNEIENYGQYGVANNPPVGTDVLIINKGGRWISIAMGDRKFRLAVEPGAVALYDDKGQKIHLSAAGIYIFDKNGNKISMNKGEIDLNGVKIKSDGEIITPSKLTAGGDILSGGAVKDSAGITLGTHTHSFPYNGGPTPSSGITNPPGP